MSRGKYSIRLSRTGEGDELGWCSWCAGSKSLTLPFVSVSIHYAPWLDQRLTVRQALASPEIVLYSLTYLIAAVTVGLTS